MDNLFAIKSKKRFNRFLLYFILGNIIGIINTLVVITTHLAEGGKIKLIYFVIWEFTGAYSFALLAPLMHLTFTRLPLVKNRIINRLPIYFFVIALLGAAHTLLMYASRLAIYNLGDLGNYDYGYLPYRYVMETLKLGVGFFTFYFFYNYIKSNREKQEEKLKSVQLEEQLSRTRLEFLKNQLNPHFLFNTLNMISSTMYEDVQSADKMLADLSDLLRISLKSSHEKISLNKESEILNLYFDIMKARFKDKLEIDISIEKNTEEALVPSFILQPLVENSIKFGMETLSGLKIKVNSQRTNDKLMLTIYDDGPGIGEPKSDILKKGVGISNTMERLEKLYGSNFEFSWQNCEPHGLQIQIIIPFQKS